MYNTNLYRHIGAKIQKRREALGLSLSEAASVLNMKTEELQEYESGNREIFTDVLLDFKRVFGVSIDYYFQEFE